jgi:histidinol-phosphate aminotransferase
MLKARSAVEILQEYHPPLAARTGMRLDFNENVDGCSPRVLARLASLTPEDLTRYPERAPVEAMVASFLKLPPENVLLTNGADEAIHLLCETYLNPGDEVLVVVPTFSMYAIYAAATGARVISIPATDFRFPLRLLLANLTSRTRMIAIANPNNPTGTLASAQDLVELACRAPQAALLIDEAYFEFCGQTLLHEVSQRPNLFVARTFSKAYGLAGLRIGVLAGSAEQMPMVRRVSSPYNVNQVALKCLPEALADQDYVNWYAQEVKNSRESLEQELRALHIPYWTSHANFVLTRLGDRKNAFVQGMRQRGILVRDRSSDPGCEGCVRITVGTTQQTLRLLESLRDVLQEIETARELPA